MNFRKMQNQSSGSDWLITFAPWKKLNSDMVVQRYFVCQKKLTLTSFTSFFYFIIFTSLLNLIVTFLEHNQYMSLSK